ncbi:cell division transport system permease protein [uncultured Gammaproteobacteria bacterium]
MFGYRLDLPLADDATGRFLSLIIGLMVYLAMLALAGAMALADLGQRWETGLSGRVTVQVLPIASAPGAPVPTPAELTARVSTVITMLRGTPGVIRAEVVPLAEVAKLLDPWLNGALPDDLPVPALIDVVLTGTPALDLRALGAHLAETVPGARLDDHGRWLADLRTLAGVMRAIALLIVALVCGAGMAAVVFAVRTGLAIHQEVINLLHVMGATDGYVAHQFAGHILGLATRGGSGGLVLAVLTLIVMSLFGGEVGSGLLPTLTLGSGQWLLLLLVPLVAGVLAVVTAQWTVIKSLAALP